MFWANHFRLLVQRTAAIPMSRPRKRVGSLFLFRKVRVKTEALFFDNPSPDVGRAIPEFRSVRLAKPQKPDRIATYESYLFEVEDNFPMLCLKQGSQLDYVLWLNPTTQRKG